MSTPYNMAFACLECCKSFKRKYKLIPKEYPSELPCPNCGGISYNLGRHFKAPKKTDKKQWDKLTVGQTGMACGSNRISGRKQEPAGIREGVLPMAL